jgi:hypothetical protein
MITNLSEAEVAELYAIFAKKIHSHVKAAMKAAEKVKAKDKPKPSKSSKKDK